MLRKILQALEGHPQGLCLEELAYRFHVQPSALEGMLQTLLRMGRLVEVTTGSNRCAACPLATHCIPPTSERLFLLAPSRGEAPAPPSAGPAGGPAQGRRADRGSGCGDGAGPHGSARPA